MRQLLWARVNQVKEAVLAAGWPLPPVQSPILPLFVGPEAAALEVAARLQAAGFLIPAIRYPTVPRGEARLRLTVTAAHSPEQISELSVALRHERLSLSGPP